MDHWPTVSLLDRLLLEQWWPAVALLGGLALVLSFHALRRRSKPMGATALVFAILAGVAPLIERSVTTTRERLLDATRQLADAAIGPLDEDRLGAMLAEDVAFEVPPGNPVFTGREEVLDLARRADRRYTFESWSLGGVDAARTSADEAESVAGLSARLKSRDGGSITGIFTGGGFGVPSQWQIVWQRDGDRWVVSRIVLLQLAGRDAKQGQLP